MTGYIRIIAKNYTTPLSLQIPILSYVVILKVTDRISGKTIGMMILS